MIILHYLIYFLVDWIFAFRIDQIPLLLSPVVHNSGGLTKRDYFQNAIQAEPQRVGLLSWLGFSCNMWEFLTKQISVLLDRLIIVLDWTLLWNEKYSIFSSACERQHSRLHATTAECFTQCSSR